MPSKLIFILIFFSSLNLFAQSKEYRAVAHGTNSCPACPGGFTEIGCNRGNGSPSVQTGVLANSRYFTTKGDAFEVTLFCSGGTIEPDCDYGTGEYRYYIINHNGLSMGVSALGARQGYGAYNFGLSLCRQN